MSMIMGLSFVYFCSLIFIANGALSFTNGCDCQNPAYIDQPTNIAQCYSKSKFYTQVAENFDLQYGRLDDGTAKGCNYTYYRKAVDDFKAASIEIVDAYFNCKERVCKSAVYNGLDSWKNLVENTFYPFMACTYIYFKPECAANIKHSVYYSAENLVTTLARCSALKRSNQRPDVKLLLKELLFEKPLECNCIKMDERPIPVSEKQCYSKEYFKIVKNWISDNFSRVKEAYHDASVANPECDYSAFILNAIELENRTNEWVAILRNPHPTFKQLSSYRECLLQKAFQTNDLTRAFILQQPKKCYFTPRQLRQPVLTISHYVIQILTKCTMYRDPKNSYC